MTEGEIVEEEKIVQIKPRYMMATKASIINILKNPVDVSRKKPNIVEITGKTKNYWVGNWVFDPESTNVYFPKSSARTLRKEDILKYNNFVFDNGTVIKKIKIIF
ncbi:MAG: hypothetical protein WDK96_00780 [Candidatus Paceibacterota bacterium]|jgi:hypothetical protein